MFLTVDKWIDLSETIPVYGWATNQIITVSNDGSGKAVLVSLASRDEDEDLIVYHFLIDPQVAHAIGWEVVGTSSGYDVPNDLNGMTVAIEGHSIMDDLGMDEE